MDDLFFFFFYLYICFQPVTFFFFSSRRRYTRSYGDWSSDVCSSDLSGELELRWRRLELVEHELAVAQDVDLAAFHAPVHPPRHLEDLVRAEVEPGQDVPTSLDDIGVARVVDHHGVEAADVEGGLARRRHRQQKRPAHLPVEERPDDSDRLTPVVERRRHSLPAVAELLRDLLDFGPGGHEHRHATPLTQDALHEAIVQELERLLRQDAHIGRPRGI